MLHFTTFFDKNYLSRGEALYHSILSQTNDFQFHILCLDDYVYQHFLQKNYANVTTLQLNDIEKAFPELLQAKANRNTIAYYFTLSPYLPLYFLKIKNLPHICSLDADILFYSNPQIIFDYLQTYSVIITPHKFSIENSDKLKYGTFNVSFQIFKNDAEGIACLQYWQQQCLEWCNDEYDSYNERFADQLYLNSWINRFPSIKILSDDQTGLAPWNVNNYKLTLYEDNFYSNQKPLIYYHFHGFKIINNRWATHSFIDYSVKPSTVLDNLYLDYWNILDKYSTVKTDASQRNKYAQNTCERLLKAKNVFKRKNNQIKRVDFRYIPKFLRNISIAICRNF